MKSKRRRAQRPKLPGYVLVCALAETLKIPQGNLRTFYLREPNMPKPSRHSESGLLAWGQSALAATMREHPEILERLWHAVQKHAARQDHQPPDFDRVKLALGDPDMVHPRGWSASAAATPPAQEAESKKLITQLPIGNEGITKLIVEIRISGME